MKIEKGKKKINGIAKSSDSMRVTSIARKINWNYIGHLMLSYFFLDVLLFLVAAAVFLVGMDMQMTGRFSFAYVRNFSFGDALRDVTYTVSTIYDEQLYEVPIGIWLVLFYYGAVLVLLSQLTDLIAMVFMGTREVRKELRPLNQIAVRAQQLSNIAFDESKYHNLEDAISNLKVDSMDKGIHMHDKELQGIETALNDLLGRIRASYKQQAQFVSDASHELRTPIAVIQGYVNMLDRWGKEDTAILEESIEAIKNESNHMQKLVEQLLFLARGDSNRQSLDMKMQDLNSIMREVYEESLMIDENHRYRFEECGYARVYGDCDMMKQSARILIDNAAKYTKTGEEILIRVGVWKDGSPFYGIQDNGIGMSQEIGRAHV